jgi:redox-sensitive bicupin YhaK (pirin superfamily)
VVHEEVPVQPGKTVHMLQIFINLARDRQGADPFALSLEPEDVPVLEMPGIRMRVPLGSFGDVHSPLQPPTDVTLLDVFINEGAELTVPVSPGHNTFVLPIYGTLTVDDDEFDINNARVPVFPAERHGRPIRLRSRRGGAKVVVFSGPPLRQSVHWHGPLALASEAALADALTAYRSGAFGELPPAQLDNWNAGVPVEGGHPSPAAR